MLNVARGLADAPFRLVLAGLGLMVFYGIAAQVGGLQGHVDGGRDLLQAAREAKGIRVGHAAAAETQQLAGFIHQRGMRLAAAPIHAQDDA